MNYWKNIYVLTLILVLYSIGISPGFAGEKVDSFHQIHESTIGADHSHDAKLGSVEFFISEFYVQSLENKSSGFAASNLNSQITYSFTRVGNKLVKSFEYRDKRKFIASTIFPFHFFW